MARFSLSNTIDANKIFLVKRSELEGRLDSSFYIDKVDYSHCIRLSKTAKVKGGKRIPLGYDYDSSETSNLYLRVVNMDENSDFDYTDFKYISDELYQILHRYEVFEGDLIISIAGTVGKIKLVKKIPQNKKVILTENCAKIELIDKETILPDFFDLLLKTEFIKKQISLSYIQTTIPKLGIDKILGLKIPKPLNISKQKEIIKLYQNAYSQKQQKEVEAKALLESIDSYLLRELGITLPEKDNSLLNRIFTTQFSNLTGGRFDVFAILNKDYRIEGGKHSNQKLKLIATLLKGQSITSDKIIEGQYPVIAGGQTSPYNHNQFNHAGNIITVSASGAYSGYVWYHTSPIFASDCTVIFSKDENKISTLFLFEILKLKQQEIYHLQQGAGQPHVYAKDLKELQIPIPPIEKQNEITSHIQEIRTKAKQLQEDAKNVLDEAKKEVERMILGSD